MLKQAFNALTGIHSRAASLKRLGASGSASLWSPIRITPSNYFRFLEGPSQTVIRGREFVIPIDTITGTPTQLISFSDVPTLGTWNLLYNATQVDEFDFDASAATIQTALRLVTGLSYVTVVGDYTAGFLVTFYDVQTPLALTTTMGVTPIDATITVAASTSVPWALPIIKRSDRIVDSIYGTMTIDEVVELVDLGGTIMGFRCRCE